MEPLENLQRYFESTNADIIVCGHGHIPFFKEFNGRYVINPGSVGQPKDNVKKACYVFMDLATREMVFERVDYNINELFEKMEKENFPEILIKNFHLL